MTTYSQALASKPLEEVKALNKSARTRYFNKYARYFGDAPLTTYGIRVGSVSLFANDTSDLREQFDKFIDKGIKTNQ